MAAPQAVAEIPDVDPQNMELLIKFGSLVNNKAMHEMTISQQRDIFRQAQSPAAKNPCVTMSNCMINTFYGDVKTVIYKPRGAEERTPFVYFVHGGGFIVGSSFEWEAFLFDLVMRTGLAVVFPEYTLAPEKKFPAQLEQCLEVLQHLTNNGKNHGLKTEKLSIASDSIGGSLALAICMLNRERSLKLPIIHQILLHPQVNPLAELGTGPFMSREWTEQYFDAYFSTVEERCSILGAPGTMSVDQARRCMPPTDIIVSDNDALKPQGENLARLLQSAGVPCGLIEAKRSVHDVEIFNIARESATARLIMAMISGTLKQLFAS